MAVRTVAWKRVPVRRALAVAGLAVALLAGSEPPALASAPPTVSFTSAPTNPSATLQPKFWFIAHGAASAQFFCSLDGVPAASCVSPITYTVGSGPHTLSVSAKSANSAIGPAAKWNWTATGIGEGDISPWALQVENPQSNFGPVAPHQALLDAQHFNFIIAHPIAYQGQVAAMKKVNPRLKLLVYLSGTFAQPSEIGSFSPTDFEYDAKGNKITSPFGTYLMNPTSSVWIHDRTSTCQAFLAESGYDGCYLDTLGLVALSTAFVTAPPLNPSTNQPWTPSDWIAATSTLAAQIRAAMTPVPVFGNGLTGGAYFYSPTAPTKPFIDAMDGGIAEAWLRGATIRITGYPTMQVWLQNIQMIPAVEAEQKPLLTLMKVWVSGTPSQISNWGQFALATFLLGTQGRSSFSWSPGPTVDRMTDWPFYHLAIGQPVGQFTKLNGVYQRSFTQGIVLVNPGKTSVPVHLATAYYDVNGNPLTSFSMAPESGEILTANQEPTTTILSPPPTSTSSTSATVGFSSGTANATFACQVDGGASLPCTSPLSLSGLAEGPHSVSVQAVTPAGIVGPAVLADWTVEITAPTTTILSAPPSTTTSGTETVTFSAKKPAVTFSCSLDGATSTTCTPGPGIAPTLISPCCGWSMSYANLATGTHSVAIYATDAYGLAGPPVTATWTVS